MGWISSFNKVSNRSVAVVIHSLYSTDSLDRGQGTVEGNILEANGVGQLRNTEVPLCWRIAACPRHFAMHALFFLVPHTPHLSTCTINPPLQTVYRATEHHQTSFVDGLNTKLTNEVKRLTPHSLPSGAYRFDSAEKAASVYT